MPKLLCWDNTHSKTESKMWLIFHEGTLPLAFPKMLLEPSGLPKIWQTLASICILDCSPTESGCLQKWVYIVINYYIIEQNKSSANSDDFFGLVTWLLFWRVARKWSWGLAKVPGFCKQRIYNTNFILFKQMTMKWSNKNMHMLMPNKCVSSVINPVLNLKNGDIVGRRYF